MGDNDRYDWFAAALGYAFVFSGHVFHIFWMRQKPR